jgi:hypothetical protein
MFSSWLHNTLRSFLLYALASVGVFFFAAAYAVLRYYRVGQPWLLAPIILGFVTGLALWDFAARLIRKERVSMGTFSSSHQSTNPTNSEAVRYVGLKADVAVTASRLILINK